jgi:hypothetical protein
MNLSKYISENLHKALEEQAQDVSYKQTTEFLNSFGMMLSFGFSQIHQQAKDEESLRELKIMQKNIRKPIINGKNFFEICGEPEYYRDRNSKIIQAILSKARELLIYIEPRIQQFVKDSETKTKWLSQLAQYKETYKQIVSK